MCAEDILLELWDDATTCRPGTHRLSYSVKLPLALYPGGLFGTTVTSPLSGCRKTPQECGFVSLQPDSDTSSSLPPSLSRPSLRLSLCICLSFPFPFCFPFLSSIHPLHVVLFFLSPSLCELAASKTIGGEGRGGGFNAPFSSLVNKPVLPRGGMAWHGMTGSVALAMEGETATNPSHRERQRMRVRVRGSSGVLSGVGLIPQGRRPPGVQAEVQGGQGNNNNNNNNTNKKGKKKTGGSSGSGSK
uniref:Uncharacterized protein n=1 Tax=Physcomitrium patens TaxID=3218 RepID=A0A2K1IZ48_PHYPA|nr:hypothetical protein PHYPA_024364 [Physcomitrium patens]